MTFDYQRLTRNKGHKALVRDVFDEHAEGFIGRTNLLGFYLIQSLEHRIFYGRDTMTTITIQNEVPAKK